jgi:3-oxoacyl-[acyl-carrier protein] reductase
MDLGLTGRTAIVLGASQGMGLAIATALRAEGANVAIFARNGAALEREAVRIGSLAVTGDLTRSSDLDELVDRVIDEYRGLDILVLNGGGPPPGSAVTMSVDDVTAAVGLLLAPHVHLVARCLPHLRASEGGRIVAIESTSVAEPIDNLALSNAIRPGVVGWLKTLARELGPEGITVNTVAPGLIDTDRLRSLFPDGLPDARLESIPLRRPGTAAEIANVVTFLASDRGSYISGALIKVDGGSTRGLI